MPVQAGRRDTQGGSSWGLRLEAECPPADPRELRPVTVDTSRLPPVAAATSTVPSALASAEQTLFREVKDDGRS